MCWLTINACILYCSTFMLLYSKVKLLKLYCEPFIEKAMVWQLRYIRIFLWHGSKTLVGKNDDKTFLSIILLLLLLSSIKNAFSKFLTFLLWCSVSLANNFRQHYFIKKCSSFTKFVLYYGISYMHEEHIKEERRKGNVESIDYMIFS